MLSVKGVKRNLGLERRLATGTRFVDVITLTGEQSTRAQRRRHGRRTLRRLRRIHTCFRLVPGHAQASWERPDFEVRRPGNRAIRTHIVFPAGKIHERRTSPVRKLLFEAYFWPAALAIPATASLARLSISAGATSSTCCPSAQEWPNGSFTCP
jgi:hypothetical protein